MAGKFAKSWLSDTWYDLCEKYEVLDWIDDNIVYYVIDKPIDWYKTVRHWFQCNWNIEHLHMVKAAFTSYGWDYSFGWEMEELFIDKQLKWFRHHQRMIEEQYNHIMWSLEIAKYCIHIMNNENDLFEYVRRKKTNKYVYRGPRINHRNLYRFMSPKQYEHLNTIQEHDLYLLKVKSLYYLTKHRYAEYWWD